MKKHAILFTLILLTSACFRSGVEKEYAGGDHYEERQARDEQEAELEEIIAPPPPPIQLTRRLESGGLEIEMQPEAESVKAGSSLSVEVSVHNRTRGSLPLVYTSGKRFDLVVFEDMESTKPVYVWSEEKFFTQEFLETQLGGGAKMARILEIPTTREPQGDESNADFSQPLPPGVYFLWATHEGQPALAIGPELFTVDE